MRLTMGMSSETDTLPAPRTRAGLDGEHNGWEVPDWLNPGSEGVATWIEGIAEHLSQDLNSNNSSYPKVMEEDKDHQVILVSPIRDSRTLYR